MPTYDGARVRERMFFDGYQQAMGRFQDATTRDEHRQAFFALFEALNWAHALDDVIAEILRPEGVHEGLAWRRWIYGGAEVLAGLRYARNRVHHQWADALVLPEGSPAVWRAVKDLPAAPTSRSDQRGKAAYEQHLAGRPAVLALAEVDRVFGYVLNTFLDPPRSISRASLVAWEPDPPTAP